MSADFAGTPSRPSLIGLVVIASLNTFPPLRPTLWRWWYDTLARCDSETELLFMNYGFAQAQDEGARLALDSADEPFRYPIQLYHHVLEPLAVAGKDVLEVGCGRGGGTSYLARYHRPGTVLGVDLSSEAIARCRKHHVLPGVEFREGRAEALPCSNSSVDVVINVESSHCYASMSKFLREVARVLRPGGHFAICDLRAATGWEQLRPAFEAAGLEILTEESINGPVVRALDLVFEKRRQRIDERVPRFWRRVFRDFAGLKETVMYNMLRDGRLRYMNLLARRPL